MKVVLAKTMGFCFGVKRALEMTEKALASGEKIHILGDLIHNRAVIEKLAAKGLRRVKAVSEVTSGGTLIISAHGVSRDVYQAMEQSGISCIDTTCIFVKKAQDAAAFLCREGYEVFLVGDPDHTEVKGIVSAAGGPVRILQREEDLVTVTRGKRAGLLFQTTQTAEMLRLFTSGLAEKFDEVRVFNTICRATTERQEAVRELARDVDAVVIVGDRKSANSKRLLAIASEINPKSFMVETADQINVSDFSGLDTVGLTASASAPDWVIAEVQSRLSRLP